MTKITIEKLATEYNNRANENLKDQYLEDTLEIKKYIPFNLKVTLAEKLMEVTMYDKNKNVHVNSAAQYLLFCRIVLKNYTNITIGENLHEEYDLLKESGILDKIMVKIPEGEMAELNTVISMAREDVRTNAYEPHAFIAGQVERFGTLIGTLLDPVIGKLADEVKNLDNATVEKMGKTLDRVFKKYAGSGADLKRVK